MEKHHKDQSDSKAIDRASKQLDDVMNSLPIYENPM
jgi:hypothetical protein